MSARHRAGDRLYFFWHLSGADASGSSVVTSALGTRTSATLRAARTEARERRVGPRSTSRGADGGGPRRGRRRIRASWSKESREAERARRPAWYWPDDAPRGWRAQKGPRMGAREDQRATATLTPQSSRRRGAQSSSLGQLECLDTACRPFYRPRFGAAKGLAATSGCVPRVADRAGGALLQGSAGGDGRSASAQGAAGAPARPSRAPSALERRGARHPTRLPARGRGAAGPRPPFTTGTSGTGRSCAGVP